jgi:hypothetical protein
MSGGAEQTFGKLLGVLSNPYRRQLLVALLEHNPQDDSDRDPLDILSASGEPDVLETELVHSHLPKLEQLGYISWNKETNEISRGPRWDEIAPLLELIHNHRDELPDGWL